MKGLLFLAAGLLVCTVVSRLRIGRSFSGQLAMGCTRETTSSQLSLPAAQKRFGKRISGRDSPGRLSPEAN